MYPVMFLILSIPYILCVVALHGWALSVLWGWYIIPIFSMPELTFAQAIGVTLVFRTIS